MTATMNDTAALVRFVLGRLDDDHSELMSWRRRAVVTPDTSQFGAYSLDRLRGELIAKRRIVASLQQLLLFRDLPAEKPVRDEAWTMLRVLALPYADHRQYREQWRVSTG